MQRLTKFRLAACMAALLFCTHALKAQNRSNSAYYLHYYTGCWQAGDSAGEWLITLPDQTFRWLQPADGTDTLRGKWKISAAYTVPFKATIIVFTFADGRKKKYQIGAASGPAVIYLTGGRELHKIACP